MTSIYPIAHEGSSLLALSDAATPKLSTLFERAKLTDSQSTKRVLLPVRTDT